MKRSLMRCVHIADSARHDLPAVSTFSANSGSLFPPRSEAKSRSVGVVDGHVFYAGNRSLHPFTDLQLEFVSL